ncbi:MAG: SusC/RagA family TonB-linked outer membrane protein [Leadbetterella sp.]
MKFIFNSKFLHLVKLGTLQIILAVVFGGLSFAHEAEGQEILNKKITVEIANQDVKDAIRMIEKQIDARFTYQSAVLKGSPKINYKANSETVSLVLTRILSPLQVSYAVIGNQIVLKKEGVALENPIKGTVTDDKNSPLPGVSVRIKGKNKGTQTDANGTYSIDSDSENDVLVFSFIGYLSKEVKVGSQSIVNVQLAIDDKTLEELVVVGYGQRGKKQVSGAITTVDSKMITGQQITSVDQGLAGLLPGVTIREGSGAPGSGPEILIRGINSLSAINRPLIVIDDVIFEGNPANNGSDNQNNNILSLLNPEDIDKITVLKDAASKAIFGSRATAGVIMITTKKGKVGAPKINFNHSVGFQDVMPFEDPNVMNATELANFLKDKQTDLLRRTKATLYGTPGTPIPDSEYPANLQGDLNRYGVGTNWFDEVTRRASLQNHTISVNGGTNNVNYYFSGNFQDQDGVVLYNDFKRYSLRANLDIKINNKLKMGLGLSPSRTYRNRSADEPKSDQFSIYGSITSSYWLDPSAKVRDANGNYNHLAKGELISGYSANPVYQLEVEKEERNFTQLLSNLYLEYAPIKGLVIRTSGTNNFLQRKSSAFSPSTIAPDNSFTPIYPNVDGARISTYQELNNSYFWDNIATYSRKFNLHNLTLQAGFHVQESTGETSTLNAKNLLDETFQLPDFNNVSKAVNGNFSGSDEAVKNRLVSYTSRINYGYADRYHANFSIRNDGSSRFGRGNKYGYFPAGSLAWRVTEEPFLKDLNINSNILNEFKIEMGYGITGGNSIKNFEHLGSVKTTDYILGGTSRLGSFLESNPNSTVTWEQAKQLDYGFTADLLNKKINLAVNFYKQVTKGNLAQISTSWITGFGGVVGNQDSEVENKGFDADLTFLVKKTKKLTWQMGLNASRYKNKLLSYIDTVGFRSANAGNGTQVTWSRPGQPIGMIYGLEILGLYTQAEIDDPAVPKYTNARAGSIKYRDGNGDGRLPVPSIDDYVLLANPHPKLMFGMNHTVNYQGLSLRAIFAGQWGGAIMDLRKEFMYNVDGQFNMSRNMLDRWRPGDTDFSAEKDPTTDTDTRIVRFPNSNKVFDGSYLALKNLTLGYDLSSYLKKMNLKVTSFSLNAGIRNVFYVAKYKDGNPEARRQSDGAAVRSINYGSYPISRTYSLGLNVNL